MATAIQNYPTSLQAGYPLSECKTSTENGNIPSAKIGWMPDAEQHRRRVQLFEANPQRAAVLPEGWPQSLTGPLLWNKDMDLNSGQIYELSEEDITEVERALDAVKADNVALNDICKATFPLPTLGAKLEKLNREVHEGCGFVVLRNMDPRFYSQEENVIIYLGLSSYAGGEKRGRQTVDGAKLVHITNIGSKGIDIKEAIPVYTNEAQPFHADVLCDILGLYYIQVAASGGETILASAWQVYNELAATRPDVIQTLAGDSWVHDTRGSNPPYYNQPLLFHHDARIILNFSRRVLTGSAKMPRSQDIPPLTEAQAEALDVVHFCAWKHSIKLQLCAGDMLFVNNLAILHSRTAFQDDENHQRYAMRLWLSNPERAWATPKGLQLEWNKTFGKLGDVKDHYDIDPFEDKEKGANMVKGQAVKSSKCFG